MKTPISVIFVLLCSTWTCTARMFATTVEPTTSALSIDNEPISKESPLTAEEQVVLLRALTDENDIEPVKSEEIHQEPRQDHPHHPLSYYPAPVPLPYGQNPYSPCSYAQPQSMFYPMPMYSPYSPFPAYNPSNVVRLGASADPSNAVRVQQLLKIAKIIGNKPAQTAAPSDPTTAATPKQFFIKNWIRNKINKKTTTTTTTTTAAPTTTAPEVVTTFLLL